MITIRNIPSIKRILIFLFIICGAIYSCNPFPKRSTQQDQQCPEGTVFVKHVGECYPKVQLDFACEHSIQCEAQTENSYCGFSTEGIDLERSFPVCLCRDGHKWRSAFELKCIPKKGCTKSAGFNEHMQQYDCGLNEFCRNGVCLCKPRYSWDNRGICIYPHDFCSEPELILVPEVGCFQKVELGKKCELDIQCLSHTNSSICLKANNSDTIGICRCAEGFVDNGFKCDVHEPIVVVVDEPKELGLLTTQSTKADQSSRTDKRNKAFANVNQLIVVICFALALL